MGRGAAAGAPAGDFVIDRPGLRVYFPLGILIILSLALSLRLWLFRR